MSLNIESGDRCYISCDDPYNRGCVAKTEKMYGQSETEAFAERHLGWRKNLVTGHWTCSSCLNGEQHDVRLDGAGLSGGYPRLTCYSRDCHMHSLVRHPYMQGDKWTKPRDAFLSTHPCDRTNIKGNFPEDFWS